MTKNTKNKFHFNDQHQLYLISQDILKNVDNIFAYFGISFKSDYKKAYHILMEHFDSFPDDVKEDVHEKLNKLSL